MESDLITNTRSRTALLHKLKHKTPIKILYSTVIQLLIISAFFTSAVSFFPIIDHASVQGQSPTLQTKIKGMTINAWSSEAYNSSDFDVSITNLANLKANWVTFTVFWFMDHYNDTETHPRTDLYTASNSSLIHAIEKAHELNMKVALKPMIDVLDGKWRGQIEPYNWTLWFENYQKFINFYADLAQNHSVELFIVGTELRSSQTHESEWRNVINNVRNHFNGNLTYAANWDSFSNHSVLPNLAVKFWDVLDYIGVDAYFPLTDSYNPTLQQLINAWSNSGSGWWGSGRNWTNQLYSTYITTGKKIIFTEIGYCSQNGTNTQPWNYNLSLTKDLQEQADCYQAALEVFRNATWFEGWFWWSWETDPNAGKPGTIDELHYTPQNKPAQEVLRRYYGVPPDIAILNVSPSKTMVEKGDTIEIYVTIENQGAYTENFNISVYANQTTIHEEYITLENQNLTILEFPWNTSSMIEATYILEAFVPPLLGELDKDDNLYTDGIVKIGKHNIVITDLVFSDNINRTIVGQGCICKINVTVTNEGDFPETFNVTLYANTTEISTILLQAMLNGTSTILTFTWNTTDFARGNYTISACATPVLGETETVDNTLVDGWVVVTILGDVNGDFKVDLKDVYAVALAYGSYPSHPCWNPNLDINGDEQIDLKDYYATVLNYGKTYG